MANKHLLHWLRLIRTPGLGSVRIQRLLEAIGEPGQILAAPAARLKTVQGIGTTMISQLAQAPSLDKAQEEMAAMTRLGIRLLPMDDPLYPALLKEIAQPPVALFVQGDASVLQKEMAIGMVGSRHPSHRGVAMARHMARDLVQQSPAVIVSGLAEGIDGAAHWGALDGPGYTIAVVATGLDVDYPRRHKELRQAITRQGCILSESPLGTQPAPHLFPNRNRIISGLCQAVVVVEAALSSGSLITARIALEQGREVFAVPGPPDFPLSQGPNTLIKEGATLVESAADILSSLAWSDFCSTPIYNKASLPLTESGGLGDKTMRVMEILRTGPRQCDEILRLCQLTVGELSTILLKMEVAGMLERLPGDHVALCQDTSTRKS
ncbi:MAG: DNA-protecting protein DprA [Magnetococcales bacterium]|nr:DNA-protecting protein DprA [Magnetococcales bacterium]NGZ25963.1 DNA-protecting protein DprA [Magnetococcales bacterium]